MTSIKVAKRDLHERTLWTLKGDHKNSNLVRKNNALFHFFLNIADLTRPFEVRGPRVVVTAGPISGPEPC